MSVNDLPKLIKEYGKDITFIQCVVKPLASAMGFYDASIEFMQAIEDGQNSNCIN